MDSDLFVECEIWTKLSWYDSYRAKSWLFVQRMVAISLLQPSYRIFLFDDEASSCHDMFCQYNAFTSCLLFVTLLSWEERIVLFTKVDRDWFLTSIILLHQWSFWHLHCLGHPGGGCLYLLLTPGIGTKWEGYEISIWDLWILFTFLLLSYWIPPPLLAVPPIPLGIGSKWSEWGQIPS